MKFGHPANEPPRGHDACRRCDHEMSGETKLTFVCVQQHGTHRSAEVNSHGLFGSAPECCTAAADAHVFLHRISCLMTLPLLLQHLHELWLLARWSQRRPAHPGLCRTKLLRIESMCWHILCPRLQDRLESWADSDGM